MVKLVLRDSMVKLALGDSMVKLVLRGLRDHKD
jgi:hypothetical protein